MFCGVTGMSYLCVGFSNYRFMKADKTYTLAMKWITHIATRGLVLTLFFMFVGCGVSQEDNREAP